MISLPSCESSSESTVYPEERRYAPWENYSDSHLPNIDHSDDSYSPNRGEPDIVDNPVPIIPSPLPPDPPPALPNRREYTGNLAEQIASELKAIETVRRQVNDKKQKVIIRKERMDDLGRMIDQYEEENKEQESTVKFMRDRYNSLSGETLTDFRNIEN